MLGCQSGVLAFVYYNTNCGRVRHGSPRTGVEKVPAGAAPVGTAPPRATTALSPRMRDSQAFFAGGRNIVLARRSPPQKPVGSPAAPHAQPMRVQRTARPSGPISAPAARRGTASPVPRPTTSQSHASSCGRKTNTLARKRVKFRGSSFPCQGNKHRLTGKTSEAVFVSFVWVN